MKDEFLAKEIAIEFLNLDRLLEEMKTLLDSSEKPLNQIETRAAGSILHDFYCGIEKIFRRLAHNVDRDIPSGDNWHADLLQRMAEPLGDVRDRVIGEPLRKQLKEFLRFRHLFRNAYGFDLKWARFEHLVTGMPGLLEELKASLQKFGLRNN